MEPEVEVIQFRPPGPATTLRLPIVLAPPDMEEPQVWYFSWKVTPFKVWIPKDVKLSVLVYCLPLSSTRCVKPSINTFHSLDFSTAFTLVKERKALILHMFRYPSMGVRKIQNFIHCFSVLLTESCKRCKAGIKTRARKHQFKGRL